MPKLPKLFLSSDQILFNQHFLDHVLYCMILDTDFLRSVRNKIAIDTFKTKEKKVFVQLIYQYFDEYKEAPQEHFYDLLEDYKNQLSENLINQCDILLININKIKNANSIYLLNKINEALEYFTLEKACINMAKSLKSKQTQKAKQEMLQVLRETTSFKQDYYSFLKDNTYLSSRKEGKKLYKMYLPFPINKIVKGLNPSWLIIILGAKKGGKTFTLLDLAIEALMQGLKILFISLEMSKEEIDDRLDMITSFSGTSNTKDNETMEFINNEWVKIKQQTPTIYDITRVSEARKKLAKMGGTLYIHVDRPNKFNYLNLDTLQSKIEMDDEIIFDVVIIDYLGEMGGVEKGQKKKERIAENTSGLKDQAGNRNQIIITAMQGNRKAMTAKVFSSELISDAIEPVFVADLVLSICQTKEEENNNIHRIYVADNRHGKKGDSISIVRDLNIGQICLGEATPNLLKNSKENLEEINNIMGEDDSEEY